MICNNATTTNRQGMYLACVPIVITGCARDTHLEYGDVSIVRRVAGNFDELEFDGDRSPSNVVCKYMGQKPQAFPAFTIEGLQKVTGCAQAQRSNGEVEYRIGNDMFVFAEGKLRYAHIWDRSESRSGEVMLAKNADDPFVSLPAPRKEIERVLGKPEKVSSTPTSVR